MLEESSNTTQKKEENASQKHAQSDVVVDVDDDGELDDDERFIEMSQAAANASFSLVAAKQQQGMRFDDDDEELGDGQSTFRLRNNQDSDSIRIKKKCKVAAFIIFCLAVFGGLIGWNIYCIYLGFITVIEECDEYLSIWLLVQGFLGVITSAMVIVVSIPHNIVSFGKKNDEEYNVNDSQFERRNALIGGRVVPPSFAAASEGRRIVVGILGVVQFISVIWFIVGTTWLAKASRDICPEQLYLVSLIYICAVWFLILIACVLSIVVKLVRLKF